MPSLHPLLQRVIAGVLLLAPGGCATGDRPAIGAAAPVAERVRAILNDPALGGTRWGMVVADDAGREVIAIAADERFVPASNTKMFTTAAAFMTLEGIDRPTRGAAVRIEPRAGGAPDVVLEGAGDATLSDRADCSRNCLATLADAVARSDVRLVNDVIGDDRLYPDERWGPGWSWNNLQTRSGTAASALTVNDNEVALLITPGAIGQAPTIGWAAGDDYYTLDNRAVTGPADAPPDMQIERPPGSDIVRVYGTIPAGSVPDMRTIGIEDPADFAATRLRTLLAARGVNVRGAVRVRHRPPLPCGPAPIETTSPLARLDAPPLGDDLTLTAKVSQNLHAELLLKRIAVGSGCIADGQRVIDAMLAKAGVARAAYDFSDGSGMSTYNRVSPRGVVAFLRWTAGQPWGAAWRATLPIGGVDGTLSRRFVGTPLAGRLFAKTGTLNGVNALAGFMTAASGRTLTFAIYANDRPSTVATATPAMDAALALLAGEN